MSKSDTVSFGRRRVLKAVLGLSAYGFAARCLSADSRPNLILIIADDFSLEFDRDLVKTPFLTALAEESIVFTNAYAAAPSCSPARASIFTGVYPHRHGVLGLSKEGKWFQLAAAYREKHIVQYLSEAGYYTGNLGKLHVDPVSAFDFDCRVKADMRDPVAVARGLSKFFSTTPQDRPFFLIVGLFDPHAINNEFVDQYKGLPLELVRPEQVSALPFQLVDDYEQRKRIAGYYNSIQRLDTQLGAVLQEIRRRRRLDDSLVIFTSDQGPAFTRSKTTVYEAAMKVPLYVRTPGGARRGKTVAQLTSHIDIAPTLLGLANVSNEHLPGLDLREVAVGERQRRFLFTEANYHFPCRFFPQRGVRDSRYKLIENLAVGIFNYARMPGVRGIDGDRSFKMAMQPRYHGTIVQEIYRRLSDPPRFELYDLSVDPNELSNLAGSHGLGGIEQTLREAIRDWQVQDDDPYREAEYIRTDRNRYCRMVGRENG